MRHGPASSARAAFATPGPGRAALGPGRPVARLVCASAGVLLAVLGGGCATNKQIAASPKQHPTLQNIPIPEGFRMVDDRSVGVATGPMRTANFQFSGDADRTALYNFYKEYMPSGGWKLNLESVDRGVYDLRYVSDTEECNVRLSSEGGKSVIVVVVTPLARPADTPIPTVKRKPGGRPE